MTRSLACRVAIWGATAAVSIACGEVPTLADEIAYIAPIDLPAPAVALGDTLRDSFGRAAAIRVVAFDRNNNRIPDVTATFVVTSAPTGVSVSPAGFVVAKDSTGTLRLVARIGDRLQTTETSILVVPQPDSITMTGARLEGVSAPGVSAPMQVTVTGIRNGARVPVAGIIVRYEITNLVPDAAVDSTRFRLLDDANNSLRSDPRVAMDTTRDGGTAERKLTVITAPGVTAVRVTVTAKSLRGAVLRGSPLTFIIPIK